MSTRLTWEDGFIKFPVSAYGNTSWADAALERPDAIDRTNPAIDQMAIRKSACEKLAIEHTIIEAFAGEKVDPMSFGANPFEIKTDKPLFVPGQWIRVFVPLGTLQFQPQGSRNASHCWAH
jgi:hypothetical protein